MVQRVFERLRGVRAGLSAALLDRPWLREPPSLATRADILACFRLLLGRNPNREEWRGHAARAGEDLTGVVASYLNSLEFSRRELIRADAAAAAADLAVLDGFRIYTLRDDPAVSRPVGAGQYEPDVTAVFRRLLRPGMRVVDLGANIGYFTMLAAHLVGPGGQVLAVEPSPRNARLIEASRRENGFHQVSICQAAAGRAIGLLALHSSYSNGTTSALADGLARPDEAQTVACLPIDLLLATGGRVDLVKIDVEGAEYNALLGGEQMLRRDRPVIVSEFSPDLMPGISGVAGEAYLCWLQDLGYRLSVLQPDGSYDLQGQDSASIMQEYRARESDHVDLVATP